MTQVVEVVSKERLDKLLTIKRAAEYLGMSDRQIRRLVQLGRIKASKLDWVWVISRSELDRFRKEDTSCN